MLAHILARVSIGVLCGLACASGAAAASAGAHERVVEWVIESRKSYADPFNDVDVDVIFERAGRQWRMPAFWRGGNSWGVRFAPPVPGVYRYRLDSTDKTNPDLNAQRGQVEIAAYSGANELLKHGPFRVSASKRYLEHVDGTPFYWLADTWWPGLSTRLSWDGFQKLTADRKAKGFSVVQLVAGLKDPDEPSPTSPGFCNEGGCVWDPQFQRINPAFFDSADRRIQHLVNSGIAPAIVGAWFDSMEKLGVDKMKKHWRNLIARYGAYPVFWVVGGEVFDTTGEWTEIARYVRATDPYRHPVSVHQVSPDDLPLKDESLMDFALFHPGHFSWPSIAVEVAQLNTHYARTDVTRPLIVGEIGYEHLTGEHLEDFQRLAFWLGKLNGAAGHSYGADGVWESSSADKPFPHIKFASFMTWEEGMSLPGSYQVGLAAKLLRQYPWWKFEPRPDWVTPRGTTLLEPRSGRANAFHVDLLGEWPQIEAFSRATKGILSGGRTPPVSEWKRRNGDFLKPYAAGIPGTIRLIYIPRVGVMNVMLQSTPPTILKLEQGVRYHAYYWDPSLGVKVELGAVERPEPGAVLWADDFDNANSSGWRVHRGTAKRTAADFSTVGETLAVAERIKEVDGVAAVDADSAASAGLILRYQDEANYIAALYSAKDKTLHLVDRKAGTDSALGVAPIEDLDPGIRLSIEVRGGVAAAAVTDGKRTYTTPIVNVGNIGAGSAAIYCTSDCASQAFDNFEVRKSPELVKDDVLERKLYDARGVYRGELNGSGWDDYARSKHILLDAYRPERFPSPRDWVLVLEPTKVVPANASRRGPISNQAHH